MQSVYNQTQIRELEQLAIKHGISSYEMMRRAGYATFTLLRKHWPQAKRIILFCGTGNNGGDGYVLARLLHEHGLRPEIRWVGQLSKLQGEALQAFEACQKQKIAMKGFDLNEIWHADLLIDAVLGIGLKGSLRKQVIEVIEKINASTLPVLAIDIPSGLDSDTGTPSPIAVQADVTVTFIGYKLGLLTNDGPDYSGRVFHNILDLPQVLFDQVPALAHIKHVIDYRRAFPHRLKNSHKGSFGHTLVVGGMPGMSGAIRLAALGAARIGSGLMTIATAVNHADLMNLLQPEIMCYGIETAEQLQSLLARATVCVVGPGLGQIAWSQTLFQTVLNSSLPLVIDGDALTLLSKQPQNRANWILTPHPGEAARLLGISTAMVQADRYQAVMTLQQRYGGVIVLKGCGTLITDGKQTVISTAGNPGMASAGMGDLLTGVIAGLVAQHLDLFTAACLGVVSHAEAGDAAATKRGQRGLLASDLLNYLG